MRFNIEWVDLSRATASSGSGNEWLPVVLVSTCLESLERILSERGEGLPVPLTYVFH